MVSCGGEGKMMVPVETSPSLGVYCPCGLMVTFKIDLVVDDVGAYGYII